jgi:uncharacterized protein
MRLYLDACAIIYAHEGVEGCRTSVTNWLAKAGGTTDGMVMTSSLSRLECRVRPLRDSDAILLGLYDAFFARRSLAVLPVSDAVLDQATQLRAVLNIKTPDAIHLASAMLNSADVFLTNDASLQRCKALNVVILGST